jgi:hypothetical protein
VRGRKFDFKTFSAVESKVHGARNIEYLMKIFAFGDVKVYDLFIFIDESEIYVFFFLLLTSTLYFYFFMLHSTGIIMFFDDKIRDGPLFHRNWVIFRLFAYQERLLFCVLRPNIIFRL